MASENIPPREHNDVMAILRKVDFLAGVPDSHLKNVLFSLQKQHFEAKKTIIFQGEVVHRLFLIRKGSVVISVKNKGRDIQLAELKTDHYFGEISLLRPLSATATVTAGDHGLDALILSYDALASLSLRFPGLLQRIQEVINARLLSRQKAKESHEKAA